MPSCSSARWRAAVPALSRRHHPPTNAPNIAFVRSGLSLWVANADGSSATHIADIRGYYIAYDWSPDGRQLVFQGGSDSASYGIYVANADGTGLRRLTAADWSWNLAWSPDGSKIAFVTNAGIHVMHADGTGQVMVADSYCFTGPPDPISAAPPTGRGIAGAATITPSWGMAALDPNCATPPIRAAPCPSR